MELQEGDLGNDYIQIFAADREGSIDFTSPLLVGSYFDSSLCKEPFQISWDSAERKLNRLHLVWRIKQSVNLQDYLQIYGESTDIGFHLSVEVQGNLICLQTRLENKTNPLLDNFEFTLTVPFLANTTASITWPYCSGWSLPIPNLESGDKYSMHYPVKAAMQWISLFNQECGLYFGVHDPVPIYKTLSVCRRDETIDLNWEFPNLSILPGETVDLPPVYLGVHKDGWQGGANIYQQWARSHYQMPATPVWYSQQPTWAWVGLREQYAEEYLHMLDDMRQVSDQVADGGVELLQLTGYNPKGHDTQFPDYWPGENFGGAVGLREQVENIHSKNRWMSIYVNGRIVDPDSSLTEDQRNAWVVRVKENGRPQQETYGVVTFDVMCPGASGWCELFRKRLEDLANTFRIDGIYIDQVSAATAHPCYTKGHEHDKPNLAWCCYLSFLKGLREGLVQINPQIFLATEGVNDAFGQFFDSQQAHNDWMPPFRDKGEPLYELYRYAYPDHILLIGTVTDDPKSWKYLKWAHVLGCGIDFGVRDWDVFPKDFLEKAKWVQNWYKKNYRIYQKIGVNPLETNFREIKANIFIDSDTLLVNGAWLSDESETFSGSESILDIEIPPGREISTLSYHAFGEEIQPTWFVEEGRLQVQCGFVEFFGIKINLRSIDGE